ncbi:MAG: heavy-metal-associated domain-containing protein [Allosphingosinicella sp.]|uniref:heavy-metal-associated domain-containing protein n=1 Tax=Allosphingosinicella sp. TaxID=2823234 RepID=UPI003936BBFD
MQFRIDNMTCGGCARGVTKAVQSIDPQAEVSADVPARLLEVRSERPAAEIAAALDKAGFPAAVQG